MIINYCLIFLIQVLRSIYIECILLIYTVNLTVVYWRVKHVILVGFNMLRGHLWRISIYWLTLILRGHLIIWLAFLAPLTSIACVTSYALPPKRPGLRHSSFQSLISIHDYFFLHYFFGWLPISLITPTESADIIKTSTLEWVTKLAIASFQIFICSFITE